MKKIKAMKNSQTKKANEFEPKRNDNTTRGEASVWPEEYEEQRSTNIRMKDQPFQSSKKIEKIKTKK